jgi:hypothetical protein
MIVKRWVVPGLLAAAAACRSAARPPAAPAQPPPAIASSSPGPVAEGESLEAAVLVPADNEEDGIAWENNWIYDHHGRFRRRSGGLASLNGRRYDVLTVELSDHTERVLYFDITDFYGRQKPAR